MIATKSEKVLKTLFILVVVMFTSTTAFSATYTVTNTNDSGPDSLREAIDLANANSGLDLIAFNIPGSVPHTIQPLSPLPVITDPVTIDGYTQPGAKPATYSKPAKLLIELDGSNVSDAGLKIWLAGNSTVRGLVINSFGDVGIHIQDQGGNVIEGNYIGTDVTGTVDKGNWDDGLRIWNAPDNTIGGITPEALNVISGNGDVGHRGNGVEIILSGSVGNMVQGNYIGTDVTGTVALGNFGDGVSMYEESSANTITGNTISNNDGRGIFFNHSSGNYIYNNNFIDNGTQAHVEASSGNVFNLGKPIGGNYWSNWATPDADGDGFVDVPYEFDEQWDNLPWACQDGWRNGCLIQQLIAQVEELDLPTGIENSLNETLEAAARALDNHNVVAAISTLEAFVREVEAQRGKKISEADADALIADTQEIIDLLMAD